jgi:hypothetical protein
MAKTPRCLPWRVEEAACRPGPPWFLQVLESHVSEPPGPAEEGQMWSVREGVLLERRDVLVRERVM